MVNWNKSFNYIFLFILLFGISCTSTDYSPKPRGFFRIVFPETQYVSDAPIGCPFSFERPIYANLTDTPDKEQHPCWKNIDFPQFNARLHLSYFAIGPHATLTQLTEDARTFAFKHTAKATAIDQAKIYYPENDVFGLTYTIEGNTASSFQFFVSDSTRHYLRGALYFNEKPNLDSIQPVLAFLKTDVEHLISTVRWK
ncbi:gliding motility lipoprotein GldD [Sphingobacterium sp. LRF_L2]|uniref:gliding motility lipoprotein GldD n=1 Tax=Sphingobacterium sp. LRF_L2 TaxID=3369421 RepID=UPI003F60D6FB